MTRLIRRRGFRFYALVCISIFLLLIVLQIANLSRLSEPTKYPWEEGNERRSIHSEFLEGTKPTLDNTDNDKQPITINEESLSQTDINPSQNSPLPTKIDPDLSSEDLLEPMASDSKAPECEPKGKDALSALERAKTSDCKNKIKSIICLAQENMLYNVSIRNECPIGRNPAKQFKSIPYSEGKGPDIRIVFLLSVHGRAVRQIKRLFKAIYHSNHYYYIHVDYHSDYLFEELKLSFKDYSNVYFPEWRIATIWGGASLLQMLLRALEELEYRLPHWKWDFFINLSESDFPLKTNDELVQFLKAHRRSNFVKTHGGDIKKFIQKQGLDRTFVECDYHMWRIGNRPLPDDITIDGGSDWIAINRNYSHYLITNQGQFLKGLKKYYEFSLLPAESFFHTVLRNGPMCETLVRSNLHITNWNRKLGCRCQYKHVVDWCGCSPNDFLDKDLDRIKNPKEDQFFGRKFEAIVNQHVINELDAHLFGSYPANTSGLNSYWENMYHSEFEAKAFSITHYTVFHSFMRIGLQHIMVEAEERKQFGTKRKCYLAPEKFVTTEAFAYYESGKFMGYVARFKSREDPGFSLESFFTPVDHVVEGETDTCPKLRSATVEVGSKWDGKESVFRNYGGVLGINDQPTIAIRMKIGRLCHVDVSWMNPLGVVEQKSELKLDAASTVNIQKLNLESPIMPGEWVVRVTATHILFVEKTFVVFPVVFNENGDRLLNPSFSNAKRITLPKPGIDAKRYMDWRINVMKNGTQLEEWLDQLITRHWSLKSTCMHSLHDHQKNDCGLTANCKTSSWSTYYPDTKSELGPPNLHGRIR